MKSGLRPRFLIRVQMTPDKDLKKATVNNKHDAWNPGLESIIPPHLNNLITLFNEGNAFASYQNTQEAVHLTGLSMARLADLNFERMAVHELLIRVTAELSVPDGPSYEYLGLQLRGMVETIHQQYLKPELSALNQAYDGFRADAKKNLLSILAGEIQANPNQDAKQNKGWLGWLKPKKAEKRTASTLSRDQADLNKIQDWTNAAHGESDPNRSAQLAALAEIGRGILGQRGRLSPDHDLMADLALRLYCQDYGTLEVRRLVAPIFDKAVAAEGYRVLPNQTKRIVMNTKGASAAGKSTIRPHQRKLAKRLGIPWKDFALISPDYWRKYLIDYDGLGDDYKYAAMLTGMELAVIDQKLDRLMAEKAKRNDMPHMLIDRFRFDSFMVSDDGEYESRLLTRFGDMVYLFFVITPPHETVERAWQRGLTTQRYKAVDDLLYHNIEAYKGMPELFFSWTAVGNKTVHYEFLDNDVPLGEDPRTIAFGENAAMTILDPKAMDKIDRFRHVNIHAKRADDVLEETPDHDYGFLRQCITMMASITWADHATGSVWGEMKNSKWQTTDSDVLPDGLNDDLANDQAFQNALNWPLDQGLPKPEHQINLTEEKLKTIGRWADQ